MFAKRVEDSVLITMEHNVEGQIILEAPCEDYDVYKFLPHIISYKDGVYAKTGWNSDKGYACYKPTLNVAHSMNKVRNKVNDAHRSLVNSLKSKPGDLYVQVAKEKLHEVGVLLGMYTND